MGPNIFCYFYYVAMVLDPIPTVDPIWAIPTVYPIPTVDPWWNPL